MENQIDVGDQNTQQVGQSPVAQTVQISEKLKANYWVIFTILFLLVILATTIFLLFKNRATENTFVNTSDGKNNRYWQKQAIELKNPTLCENSEAFVDIDILISKEYAIKYCKMEYAIATGEIKYCYESNNKTDSLTCLEKIAETFNMPNTLNEEICTNNFLDDNKLFSECIKRSARIHNDDHICSILTQKKLLVGEQTCLRYAAMNEKRIDEFTVETTFGNLPVLLETCSQYKMKANQMACYGSLARKIDQTEGWIPNTGVKKIQDYCQDTQEKRLLKICLYDQYNTPVIANTTFFQKQAIKLATKDFMWQQEMCEALKWMTFGSTTVLGDIRVFADETCGLKMYLKDPFSFDF